MLVAHVSNQGSFETSRIFSQRQKGCKKISKLFATLSKSSSSLRGMRQFKAEMWQRETLPPLSIEGDGVHFSDDDVKAQKFHTENDLHEE
jgi:hypothetical protein